MSTEFPIIEFSGIAFHIDAALNEFRQVTDPSNKISFDELYDGRQEGYILAFDKIKMNAFSDHLAEGLFPDHVEIIHIPSFFEIDPVGLARKYSLPDDFFG